MNTIYDFLTDLTDRAWSLLNSSAILRHSIVNIFIIALTLVCLHYTRKTVSKLKAALSRRLDRQPSYYWYHKLLKAGGKPLQLIIALLGIIMLIEWNESLLCLNILELLQNVRTVVTAAAVVWFALEFIRQIELHLLTISNQPDTKLDKHSIDIIIKILRVIVLVSGTLIVLQACGLSISGLLAFGGLSGVALGFAAKDLLANLFGTIVIYWDKPFTIGESIKVLSSPSVEGTVENIGWRVTTIRTYEKKLLYIPNSIFASVPIENSSQLSHRLISENILIRHQDHARLPTIISALQKALSQSPTIDKTAGVIVSFDGMIPEGLKIFIQCLSHETNFAKFYVAREQVMHETLNIIQSHGAAISSLHRRPLEAG